MPTTFTGLLLFVVLLLPGFAYLVGKERHGVERRLSTFREMVSIVAASVASELTVVIVTSPAWAPTVNFEAAITKPSARAVPLALWSVGLLLAATLLAYLWSWPRPRRWLSRTLKAKLADRRLSWVAEAVGTGYPHHSTVSAWWLMFGERREQILADYGQDPNIRVGCYLDDGSYISGELHSFSQLADDTPDRDMILAAPSHSSAGSATLQPLDADAACVSARHIVAMVVRYYVAFSPSDVAEPAVSDVGDGGGSAGRSVRGGGSFAGPRA